MKVVKHSFCNLENCPDIGLLGKIEETIVKSHIDNKGQRVEGEYWVRLENSRLGKFLEGDLQK